MRIGIIGAGHIGQAFARLAVATGHDATLSNSRGPDTLGHLAEAIGCRAAHVHDVPRSSEVVVLAVPLRAVFGLTPQLFDGQVVVDAKNYYPDRDDRIEALDTRQTTTSQMVAGHFPAARIVKAFNAILAKDLVEAPPAPHGHTRALPIAGDVASAKDLVTALQADFGYDTVDAGSLADSWRFERAKPAYCLPFDRAGLIAGLAAAERDVELSEGSWRR